MITFVITRGFFYARLNPKKVTSEEVEAGKTQARPTGFKPLSS
jgi:hypothetical protein